MGRLTHVKIGDQTGADPERVAAAAERLELVYVEMEPGDALFFHPNMLHRSDQNRSPNDRWALDLLLQRARATRRTKKAAIRATRRSAWWRTTRSSGPGSKRFADGTGVHGGVASGDERRAQRLIVASIGGATNRTRMIAD